MTDTTADVTGQAAGPGAPSSKAELLERITTERAALEKIVESATSAALTAPGPDEWAIKDHLAHLAAWQRKALAVLEGRPPWEGLGVDEAIWQTGDEMALNARLYARHRGQPLSEVLATWRETNAALLATVAALPESRLRGPYWPGDTEDTRTLLQAIADNTYVHDDEHRGWITRQLRGTTA